MDFWVSISQAIDPVWWTWWGWRRWLKHKHSQYHCTKFFWTLNFWTQWPLTFFTCRFLFSRDLTSNDRQKHLATILHHDWSIKFSHDLIRQFLTSAKIQIVSHDSPNYAMLCQLPYECMWILQKSFPKNNSIAIRIISRSIDFGVLSENRKICQNFSTSKVVRVWWTSICVRSCLEPISNLP